MFISFKPTDHIMNNIKLLMAFLAVFNSGVALASLQDNANLDSMEKILKKSLLKNNEEKRTLTILNAQLGPRESHFLTFSCENNFMPECTLIAKYLDKAQKFEAEKKNVHILSHELAYTDDSICKKPIEHDLKKAQEKCPNFKKLYWDTLTTEQQASIANAVANIVRANDKPVMYSNSMNSVHRALQK